MGAMKRLHTLFHSGPLQGQLAGRPKMEREIITKLYESRHKPGRRQEVVDDFVLMILQAVATPVVEGNYVVYDTLTERQTIVHVYQDNYAWYVHPIGSSLRTRLSQYNQRWLRWIVLHPLAKEIVKEVGQTRGE